MVLESKFVGVPKHPSLISVSVFPFAVGQLGLLLYVGTGLAVNAMGNALLAVMLPSLSSVAIPSSS